MLIMNEACHLSLCVSLNIYSDNNCCGLVHEYKTWVLSISFKNYGNKTYFMFISDSDHIHTYTVRDHKLGHLLKLRQFCIKGDQGLIVVIIIRNVSRISHMKSKESIIRQKSNFCHL